MGLPGNLLALELVSEGAHATYLFRVVPRASYGGSVTPDALEAAVADVSEALIDARFLREPIALPAARLAEAEYLRYRLALAALPTLAAARARFVARLVHSDAAAWEAALRDAITWHEGCRDDAAEWPGRSAQETQISGLARPAASGAEEERTMPTFKHPCPHCGTYIVRDAAACPKCGTKDPFAPARCANCRTVIEDPAYVACPRCGKPVGAAAVAAAEAEARARTEAQGGGQPAAPAQAPRAPIEPPVAPPVAAPVAPPVAPPIASPVAASIAPSPGAAASCAACGSPLAVGASFCRDCGTPVSAA